MPQPTVDDLLRLSGEFSADTMTRLIAPAREIYDTTFLSRFNRVFFLNLEGNSISDVRFVQFMPELRVINLSSNRITTLEAFGVQLDEGQQFLPELTALYLYNNQITRIEEIAHLQQFQKLTILDLRYNPIAHNFRTFKDAVINYTGVLTLNGLRVRNTMGLIIDYGKEDIEEEQKPADTESSAYIRDWAEIPLSSCLDSDIDKVIDSKLFEQAQEQIRLYWKEKETK